ncbi:MAG: hypothetical protein JWN02_380 [Acidobacteria bacterium]|nr:hypothetical protein [Acidobacteriota bacterium]
MLTEPPCRDVVFLGAGASIAGGLPTALGFTTHLLAAREALASMSVTSADLEAIDRDLAWLSETQQRLRPAVRHLRGFNPDNIEDIFRVWGHERSQSESHLPGGAPPRLVPGYRYPHLIRLLSLALAYSPRYPSAAIFEQPNVYSWLVDRLVGPAHPPDEGMAAPTLITSNYDLLIEFAVANRADLDLTYTFNAGTGLRNIFQRPEAPRALHYLKLHGSINWWGAQPGFRVSQEGCLGTIVSESPLATIAARYRTAGDDIDMVPPAFLKDVIYREIWSDVWDEAHAVFSLCRHLLLIGYSFSPGDVLVQNMATLGLARSPFLESITVLDPHADEVIARMQASFSDDFIANTRWIAHKRRFDHATPAWATDALFRGVT